jgi:hypothetical protein
MLRSISLGAGVQSTTMALMAAHGEITPMPDCAIFADTGWEPKAVYEHLAWLMSGVLPFPVFRVSGGNLRADILSRSNTTGGRFAAVPWFMQMPNGDDAMGRRQCTKEYKLYPIRRKVREMLGGKTPKGGAEMWIGISGPILLDGPTRLRSMVQSAFRLAFAVAIHAPLAVAARSGRPPALAVRFTITRNGVISLDETMRMKPSNVQYITNRWPLIEARLNRNDCLRWLERHNYSQPPKSLERRGSRAAQPVHERVRRNVRSVTMPVLSWNQTETEQLTILFHEGLSFSRIAREIGTKTKNSVISKSKRIGLPHRGHVIACARTPQEPVKHAPVLKPAPPVTSVDSRDYSCTIHELRDRSCRFPLWDEACDEHLYCGRPTARLSEGRPYCAAHAKMTFHTR